MKNKLVRITTVPISLEHLLEGQLNFMSQYYEVTAISSDEVRLENYGKDNNVDTFYVDMTRAITPGRDLRSLYQLYKYFKKEKPTIVHTHTPKAGIAGMLAAKLAGVPIRLHTVAGMPLMETEGIKRKVLEGVEKLTYSCATMIYPNSHGIEDFILAEKLAPSEKVKVLGKGSSNGINTSHFDPALYSEEFKKKFREDLKIPAGNAVFVFVGRLVKDKGINELILAFERLREQREDISLLLVGPFEQELDPLKEHTVQRIKENPGILSVGYQKDVRPYFAVSDVLAFPSYREGFPNVVMQAGAMGLPAIVTNINGCNEIVKHDINGRVIPVKDADALYHEMKNFLLDFSKKENLRKNARNTIEENYEREGVWKAILDEYKRIEGLLLR
ncbi:glycosyltransferase family 4 protein [Autumnicola musiva]|uniref:Glycosyltransferase family 4 protein n=1 Tax=Autumnicola musiva TaxID=3075589 RepID=A0ABU3D7F9_9FLAO|nr:glycosyltransferase family 4 protein [Zunongwangia sp. F117]MDT0677474.1 glycosyltransferase family 4 protein [Zunongwangia sp. F117]